MCVMEMPRGTSWQHFVFQRGLRPSQIFESRSVLRLGLGQLWIRRITDHIALVTSVFTLFVLSFYGQKIK